MECGGPEEGDGGGRARRSGVPGAGAGALRGEAGEDRQPFGGVERHRHRLRHPRHRGAAPPVRGAVVLGLRGRRALREDRDEHGGRG